MIKILRFLVICACSVALASSMARAQIYTSVNYPGAAVTELIGGPNRHSEILVQKRGEWKFWSKSEENYDDTICEVFDSVGVLSNR